MQNKIQTQSGNTKVEVNLIFAANKDTSLSREITLVRKIILPNAFLNKGSILSLFFAGEEVLFVVDFVLYSEKNCGIKAYVTHDSAMGNITLNNQISAATGKEWKYKSTIDSPQWINLIKAALHQVFAKATP